MGAPSLYQIAGVDTRGYKCQMRLSKVCTRDMPTFKLHCLLTDFPLRWGRPYTRVWNYGRMLCVEHSVTYR